MQMPTKIRVVLALLPLSFVLPTPHLYVNLTESMPRGVYRKTNESLTRDVIVVECLPLELAQFGRARGYLHEGNCPGHAIPILKKVVGVPGDNIEIGDGYLAINGVLLLDGFLLKQDASGRELPHLEPQTITLAADEYFLLASHPRSWDSRYTGSVQRAQIIATVRPLLTEQGD